MAELLISKRGVEPYEQSFAAMRAFTDSRDSHSPDGTVRITWQDGQAMTYRLVQDGFPISTLRDSLGGIWEREILIQGNAVFTHPANGNRIVVPLR